jgi:hypothetical protein
MAFEKLKVNLKVEKKNFNHDFESNEDLKTSYERLVSEEFEGIIDDAKGKLLIFEKKLIKST